MEELIQKGIKAKKAATILAQLSTEQKNNVLEQAAKLIIEKSETILQANKKDLDTAHANNVKGALMDRLSLNKQRLEGIAEGLQQVASLEDPIGEVLSMNKRPNGLRIGQIRVPLGVIGIIYEARPNVTADAFALCLKTGNAVILRGGKEAINSNMAIVDVIREALQSQNVSMDAIQLVEDTSRDSAVGMMKLNQYLDVLIPRGGAGLIKTVVENSSVPVLETGVGNCHTYIDESADLKMAQSIAVNAKTHRPGVCNAMESLLVHASVADKILPPLCKELKKLNVEIRGDEKVVQLVPFALPAKEEDWATEYLDLILSIKVVSDLDEAIAHITKYGSSHSETIVTENYSNSQRFLHEVDAAAVYVNASTRFTDGFMFGFGAEIGISTQKLHARGPMGLKELTSTKYIIYGDGQVRS
ncbi:MAG: glutamate-5-semialdehyde dehydrogenase [Bacteroidetes bacterium]|nr:MAG: glutamate-5-semialdehyde dehydrogenase [Bacteroidota bacterium]